MRIRGEFSDASLRDGTDRTVLLALCTAFLIFSESALADSRVFAYRLFNRLNGTPPSTLKLDEMAALVDQGKYQDAAMAAIHDPSGNFYNVTLKNFFSRWSNKDQTPRQPLNDYVATAIGIVRDDAPFTQLLSEDVLYTAERGTLYSLSSNAHYEQIESQHLNLATALKKTTQSGAGRLPQEAIAGAFSLRGFGEAFYSAGTNRRALAFTMSTFLCRSMESLKDSARPDVRVRRDVTRSPGGYPAKFRNECAGCHAGMDGFSGAFAYYDFDMATQTLMYAPGQVHAKFNRNATEFPDGFVTADASWVNLWTEGQNALLGWNGPGAGVGAKSFGEMIASADGFPTCMAQKAVEAMCAKNYLAAKSPPEKDDPNAMTPADKDAISSIGTTFKSNYNMKDAFARAAVYCSK